MKIFVTGATGVVGRRAVPLMIAAGHNVTAAGRSRDDPADGTLRICGQRIYRNRDGGDRT